MPEDLITEQTKATYFPPHPILRKGFSKIWKSIRVELTSALTEMGKLNWMTAGKASRLYEDTSRYTGHEIKDRVPVVASVMFRASFVPRTVDEHKFVIVSVTVRLVGPDEMLVNVGVNDVYKKESGRHTAQSIITLGELQKLPQLVKLTFAANKL